MSRLALFAVMCVLPFAVAVGSDNASPVAAVEGMVRVAGPRIIGHACPVVGGTLLTNAHVAQGAAWLRWSDGAGNEGYARRVDQRDTLLSDSDIAVLEVVTGKLAREFPVSATPPSPGDAVFIRGYRSDSRKRLMEGRVFATRVTRLLAGHVLFEDDPKPGSSGGCVLNARGEVVAINSASLATDVKDSRVGIGVGVWGAWGRFELKQEGGVVIVRKLGIVASVVLSGAGLAYVAESSSAPPPASLAAVVPVYRTECGVLEISLTGPKSLEVRCVPNPNASPSSSPDPSPRPSPSIRPSPSPAPFASPSTPSSPPVPPSPSPVPTPTPTPTPRPSPTVGPDGNFPPPAAGTCPELWDVPPDFVTVGDMPHNGGGQGVRVNDRRWRFVFNTTPRSNQPRQWKAGGEQWPPCASVQAKRGEGPLIWWAQYPGTSCSRGSFRDSNCAVEHPSRECDAQEVAEDVARGLPANQCRRPHAYMGADVIDLTGANGGPPGVRELCAAPPNKPGLANCRKWNLRHGGATPVQ